MTRYLVSFEDGAMTFPVEELPEVSRATHDVIHEAMDAGVWVFGGGLDKYESTVVATDGTVTAGTRPKSTERLGGFCVVDVPSDEEAMVWAGKFAVSCRCAQEVRELMDDPDV